MFIRSIHKFGTMPLLTIDGEGEEGGGGGGAPTEADDLAAIEKFGQVDPPAPETEPSPAEGEGEPPEGEGEPDEGDDQDENSVQKRIDELTNARREAERREAEAAREATALRERLDKLEKGDKGDKPEIDPNAEPDPANYEFGEADAKFIADTAAFHARKAFRDEQEQTRFQGEMTKLEEKWQGNVAAAKEEFPDFDEKVTAGAERGDWACSELFALGLRDSDVGPAVAHYLANNPDESRKYATMPALLQAREFGKLEGRILAERAAKAAPEPPKPTNAPKPPAHQSRGAGGRFETPDDTDDFAAFDKKHENVSRY